MLNGMKIKFNNCLPLLSPTGKINKFLVFYVPTTVFKFALVYPSVHPKKKIL